MIETPFSSTTSFNVSSFLPTMGSESGTTSLSFVAIRIVTETGA